MKWVKWKSHQGVRHMGKHRFNPPKPWDEWTKIMGVVARCEGNHDTVVSYDGTGVTWGFMQWTFTSGRLQKLLHSMRSIKSVDAEGNETNVFDRVFREPNGAQVFESYGFFINEDGHFARRRDKKRIIPRYDYLRKQVDDICMGRDSHPLFVDWKPKAIALAWVFAEAGKDLEVAQAQIDFAIKEFKACLTPKRRPLKEFETIGNLLEGTWGTPLPAIFFNLWQNNPGAAYKLFMRASRENRGGAEEYLSIVWRMLNYTKFGNWSYRLAKNKSPRIRRIGKGLREFYGVNYQAIRKFK